METSKFKLVRWWGLGKTLYVGNYCTLTENKNEAVEYYTDDEAIDKFTSRLPFFIVLTSKLEQFD